MASAFSHAIASVAIGKMNFTSAQTRKFWLLGAFCAVIPDADAIGYWMGVPYDSLWGHRGITHSFFFAFLLAGAVMYFFYRTEKPFSKAWWALYITFFVSTASHPILDAFTTGGRGVAFFAPFWDERYFFPWRVIRVSPISITRFFSSKGIEVLKSEFIWVWIPSLTIIFITDMARRFKTK
jgi:inner membrane protein